MTANEEEPKPKIKTVQQLERFPFAPKSTDAPKTAQDEILKRIKRHKSNDQT